MMFQVALDLDKSQKHITILIIQQKFYVDTAMYIISNLRFAVKLTKGYQKM